MMVSLVGNNRKYLLYLCFTASLVYSMESLSTFFVEFANQQQWGFFVLRIFEAAQALPVCNCSM